MNEVEWYVHGCNSPLESCCMRMAPVATSDASNSTMKGFVLSGIIRIGADMKHAFKSLNASCRAAPHSNFVSFFVRSISSLALSE